MTNKEKLQLFSKAISIPLYNTDGIKWPIRSGHIISQIGDIYSVEYINQLLELSCNYDPAIWSKALPSALSIWRMSHHLINGLEKAGYDKHEIANRILVLIEVIKVLSNDEPILSDSHQILPTHLVNSYFTNNVRITIPSIVENLISLSTLLWAYSEALFFQGREICCEYHGPYTIDGSEQMLIRDFTNFFPDDLWPDNDLRLSFKTIKIVTFHKSNVSIKIEAYNNVHISGESLFKTCTGALFFIDGKKCEDATIISRIFLEISDKLLQQLTLVESLSREELYDKYIQIFWYRKKSLTDFLKIDWRPSKEVFDRINKTIIIPSPTNRYKTERGIEFIEQKFDYSMFI